MSENSAELEALRSSILEDLNDLRDDKKIKTRKRRK